MITRIEFYSFVVLAGGYLYLLYRLVRKQRIESAHDAKLLVMLKKASTKRQQYDASRVADPDKETAIKLDGNWRPLRYADPNIHDSTDRRLTEAIEAFNKKVEESNHVN